MMIITYTRPRLIIQRTSKAIIAQYQEILADPPQQKSSPSLSCSNCPTISQYSAPPTTPLGIERCKHSSNKENLSFVDHTPRECENKFPILIIV